MLPFYKPTKTVKGSLANFSFDSKGEKKAIFVEMVKQVGWDDKERTGSFSGGDKINIKLSLVEAAAILRAIEENVSASDTPFLHTSGSGSATINFTPYMRGETQVGFSLTVSKQEQGNERKNFYIGFTFQEATLLREWLKFALEHIFSGMYSDVVKSRKAALASAGNGQ